VTTTIAQQNPDAFPPFDPEAYLAERDADRAAAVRGQGLDITPQAQVLGNVLSVAISHDTVMQFYEDRLHRQIGLRGTARTSEIDDAPLNDYVYSAIQLAAALAPAAMRRVPLVPAFAETVAGSGKIESLSGDELEAFMRPIFEEAGIGPRFEVRTGYHVYGEREAPSASN